MAELVRVLQAKSKLALLLEASNATPHLMRQLLRLVANKTARGFLNQSEMRLLEH